MTHSRARAGGQIGANGEFYEGGKFIATTDHPKNQVRQKKGTGREQIELGRWEPCPEGHRPLFGQLAGLELIDRGQQRFTFNPDLRGMYAEPDVIEQRKRMIEAFNAGKRWWKRDDNTFHDHPITPNETNTMTRHRSSYSMVDSPKPEEAVFLVDNDGPLSVTNDAERVVAEVLAAHPGRRIFYRDSMGSWDELKHNGEAFTGFAPPKAEDRQAFGDVIGRTRPVRV